MRTLSLVFAVALAVACEKAPVVTPTPTPTPTPTATVEPDPVKSFEKLVTRFPTGSIGKSGETVYHLVDVTFDVKKTDSLINPIIGTINFTSTTDHFPLNMQMVFHWQGDHWKFEQLVNREDGSDLTHAGLGEELFGTGRMSDFLKSVQ
jgi:hypothetical protein